jgi:phosphotransferase system enzyme I (PtsI)
MNSEAERAARPRSEAVLTGIGASPGVACAPAFVAGGALLDVPERAIEASAVPAEIARLQEALEASRAQVRSLRTELGERSAGDEAGILDGHLMVLEDEALVGRFQRHIVDRRTNAEAAVRDVADDYVATFKAMGDPVFAERAADIGDIARRILRNLLGVNDALAERIDRPCILVADDISPSDAVSLPRDRVLGLAMARGSATSHAAIIARALEIPAVFGLAGIDALVRTGEGLAIDGNRGVVVLRPTPEDLDRFHRLAAVREGVQRQLDRLRDEPAVTPDGCRIALLANVENADETDSVLHHGAEGIGLFRSEFLWLTSGHPVSEADQEQAYRQAAERLAGRAVTIRVFDLGGDKFVSGLGHRHEANPFLGMRSIRYLLRHPDVFKAQLRAILRASVHGRVRVLYPMVSDAAEVRQANDQLAACAREVAAEGIPCPSRLPVGAMIEIPSAALTADLLAPHVDFFSIGTNDLTQYTLAVDRVNENVTHLYQPTHPAVLRLIQQTVEAGRRNSLSVCVCGEMAADPMLALLLVGLGVDELSMAPVAVPAVKDAIRKTTLSEARALAARALTARSAAEVLGLCREATRRAAPELLELV